MKNSLANIVLKRENKTFNSDAKLELFKMKFGAILIIICVRYILTLDINQQNYLSQI